MDDLIARIAEIARREKIPPDHAVAVVQSVLGWQAEMGDELAERGDLRKARGYAAKVESQMCGDRRARRRAAVNLGKLLDELDHFATLGDLVAATGQAGERAVARVDGLLEDAAKLRTDLANSLPPSEHFARRFALLADLVRDADPPDPRTKNSLRELVRAVADLWPEHDRFKSWANGTDWGKNHAPDSPYVRFVYDVVEAAQGRAAAGSVRWILDNPAD